MFFVDKATSQEFTRRRYQKEHPRISISLNIGLLNQKLLAAIQPVVNQKLSSNHEEKVCMKRMERYIRY